MKPFFTPPPPIWRALTLRSRRTRPYRRHPICSSSPPPDPKSESSLSRLRTLQRTILARRNALRAKGVDGKKDEISDRDQKLRNLFSSEVTSNAPGSHAPSITQKGGKISADDIHKREILSVPVPEEEDKLPELSPSSEIKNLHIHVASQAIRTTPPVLAVHATIPGEETEVLSGLMQLTLQRRNGDLPWKDMQKRQGEGMLSSFQLPPLHAFTTDSFSRKDGRLPRPGSEPSAENVDVHCDEMLQGLNDRQREAVLVDRDRACLVLAGPGSGKTRVLTYRIAYLVRKCGVSPYRILAVTFTNKAAGEMKERVAQLLQGDSADDVSNQASGMASGLALGTFHSICVRFLRKYGEEIGIPSNFDICDTSDSRSVVSRILKKTSGTTPDSGSVGEVRAGISKLKNERNGLMQETWPAHVYRRMSQVRQLYDEELRNMNLLDFDDLLLKTNRMLGECPKVLEELQNKYEHVLVDEWQDTNHVQFDLVSMLAGKKQNLFVVGDADQSIYKFRGADSGNVERFSQLFSNATEVALEHNYRSSGCIVQAAQSVIEMSTDRVKKKMKTFNDFGMKVKLQEATDGKGEAFFVVSTLQRFLRSGKIKSFSEGAILYRTNAQSRVVEEACIAGDVPYRLQSGVRFYERQEVKDLVGYVKVIGNPDDDNAFRRIVNTPPRGIGRKTVEGLEKYAEEKKTSMLKALGALLEDYTSGENTLIDYEVKKAGIKKLADFYNMINHLQANATNAMEQVVDERKEGNPVWTVGNLISIIIEQIGYREYIDKRSDDDKNEKGAERQANVDELVRGASRYENVQSYLENVALMVEGDRGTEEQDGRGALSLMTLHGGKGLEFEAVFIIGVEDNMIPSSRARDEKDIDEERRLLYVGMTRAKQQLIISWRANKLGISGGKVYKVEGGGRSRFLDDIPTRLITHGKKRGRQ